MPFDIIRRDRKLWLLAGWLAVVFLFGGGSRGDIQSLLYVRPAAVLVLAYGLWGLTGEQVRAHRFAFGLAAGMLALVLLHLLPLPPELWRALPGRDIVAEIDREAALGELWRPLSLVPHATRNALWAAMVPLSVLVLGVQLTANQRMRLLPVLLALGLLSALIGLLQMLGDPRGALYFYDITNNGLAVGLFANRNHQAVFLAILPPLLLVWAGARSEGAAGPIRQGWVRLWPAVAAITFIVPLILVTGSRLGVVVALVALLSLPLIFTGWRKRQAGRSRALLWGLVGGLGVAALALLTILLGRASAFDRLLGSVADEEARVQILPVVVAMIRSYAPWGSGVGTFEQVYRVHEPRAMLGPTYMNHAHNDWLEVLLTGGIPALGLLLVAMAGFVVQSVRIFRLAGDSQESRLARAGLVMILVLAFASVSDYPLRVPSLACLAVVAMLWASPNRVTG